MAFLTEQQLNEIGFAALGCNVLISDKASIYGASRIKIGNNVRIDDFCVLSAGEGGIEIGNYVHIAVFSLLIGAGKITISDYAGVSSRVSIYSSNDDYSGKFMTNPTVPDEYTNVRHADVSLGKHVIVGSGSVILPGIKLYDGAAIGALSMVTKNCDAFGVYLGAPAKKIKERKRDLLNLELEIKN
ncbi:MULTISPECIES: acyltransferase [Vibrio harveyi group]|uniref:acyltransferase n=1 Tax=Vibrio harveyi group TaxID=717610 RepID=UPI0005EFA103|nr:MULTISPECIES: acyltransferase [Vibrio harveyi group]EJL6402507.1 acyltransferase [Vibrio parahaemolyticus]ELZ7231622.1 acyltransferase [Vibrio parahaemolyticus]MCG6461602.1 acyltransferase [Vibrio parahaemolyticus]MDF5654336.1 acyltransferase [Vibrio parahaemolyticus]TOG42282.1 galactoside O-acetyltransferase [Vibrio parahaemolyticus]